MNKYILQSEKDYCGLETLETLEELEYYESAKSECITQAYINDIEISDYDIINYLEIAELEWTEKHFKF